MMSYIKYRSVDIYFVFSFVLDLKQPYFDLVNAATTEECGWIPGKPDDRKGKPPFLNIKKKRDRAHPAFVAASLHKMLLRLPAVKLTYREQPSEADESTEPVLNTFDVGLEAYARIFDNGAGCITYKVRKPENISLREIHHIFSLSQRSYEETQGMAHLQINGHNLRLYDLFTSMLRDVEHQLNDWNCADSQNLGETAGVVGSLVDVQDWLVMDPDDKHLAAQNPYVLSVLEVLPDNGGELFWQQQVNLEHTQPTDADLDLRHLELAAILLRMVYPDNSFQHDHLAQTLHNVRIPYELRNKLGTLRNYAWDRTMMMCSSRFSTLFACRDKSRNPALLVKHSLLDTAEILRTRWHMSVLLNALLDLDMEMIRATPSSHNTNALRAIIERRRQFAYFLNDPLHYNFEGGSVARLIEVAQQGLWLETLRDTTFKKLQILDQLYKDQMEVIRIEEFTKNIKSRLEAAREIEQRLDGRTSHTSGAT